jgi:hypothetical protein
METCSMCRSLISITSTSAGNARFSFSRRSAPTESEQYECRWSQTRKRQSRHRRAHQIERSHSINGRARASSAPIDNFSAGMPSRRTDRKARLSIMSCSPIPPFARRRARSNGMSPSREAERASKSSRRRSSNCDSRSCAAASASSLSIFFQPATDDMARASTYSVQFAADASSRAASSM